MRSTTRRELRLRVRFKAFLAASVLLFGFGTAAAQDGGLSFELNKVEADGDECHVYFLIDNKNDEAYESLILSIWVFRPDGVINTGFSSQIAPLKGNKKVVKQWDLESSCDEVGSFLINDVVECKTSAGDVPDCLDDITFSSRTKNELAK